MKSKITPQFQSDFRDLQPSHSYNWYIFTYHLWPFGSLTWTPRKINIFNRNIMERSGWCSRFPWSVAPGHGWSCGLCQCRNVLPHHRRFVAHACEVSLHLQSASRQCWWSAKSGECNKTLSHILRFLHMVYNIWCNYILFFCVKAYMCTVIQTIDHGRQAGPQSVWKKFDLSQAGPCEDATGGSGVASIISRSKTCRCLKKKT